MRRSGLHPLPYRRPEGFHLHRSSKVSARGGKSPSLQCLHHTASKRASRHGSLAAGGGCSKNRGLTPGGGGRIYSNREKSRAAGSPLPPDEDKACTLVQQMGTTSLLKTLWRMSYWKAGYHYRVPRLPFALCQELLKRIGKTLAKNSPEGWQMLLMDGTGFGFNDRYDIPRSGDFAGNSRRPTLRRRGLSGVEALPPLPVVGVDLL